MKIKNKKQLSLPQLIEYTWENSVTNLSFRGHGKEGHLVVASFNDKGEFTSEWCISKDDIFEIEVEEEITEDTVIDEMLLVYDNGVTHIAENKNLSFISKSNLKSAYYMNDDLRLILIWRDGKLVE